ncbi:MAG: 23S rRNA (adenine(1618)-N(6))-methyltransferase RlmF [Chitinophagales bacterium]|nr:23S rRNA (adenine(1618)-N(6))-methyltransferase RlmF [Chitinophagales bacterium]
MKKGSTENTDIKEGLHPRNKHKYKYDFSALCSSFPPLKSHVIRNNYDTETIDFSDFKAVKALNKALLLHFYALQYWDIPVNYLCPAIPGRADYIHHLADILKEHPTKDHPTNILDIGVGANCIYPIIGCHEYGWHFVGTDIDSIAVESAKKIVEKNTFLRNCVEIRKQNYPKQIFKGIIQVGEYFDAVICNPPFHCSAKERREVTVRKWKNLGIPTSKQSALNFGGQHHELWCAGGEKAFIQNMIEESRQYAHRVGWFTTLVSQKSNLSYLQHKLSTVRPSLTKTIVMRQGQKESRMIAWRF